MLPRFSEIYGPFHEACWKGYVQKGMKKKGKRTVPNCVKEDLQEIALPAKVTRSKMYRRSKPVAKKVASLAVSLAKKIRDRGRVMSEGSLRGHVVRRRGDTDLNNPDAVRAVQAKSAERDAQRGIKRDPSTDARKYDRDHITPHNDGEHITASERAGKRKAFRKTTPAPAPVGPSSNHRMMDILNHPHYKKLASKS